MLINKRGVALMGRNTTGPPCSLGARIRLEGAWRHCLACAGKPPADDDDRHQRALL